MNSNLQFMKYREKWVTKKKTECRWINSCSIIIVEFNKQTISTIGLTNVFVICCCTAVQLSYCIFMFWKWDFRWHLGWDSFIWPSCHLLISPSNIHFTEIHKFQFRILMNIWTIKHSVSTNITSIACTVFNNVTISLSGQNTHCVSSFVDLTHLQLTISFIPILICKNKWCSIFRLNKVYIHFRKRYNQTTMSINI